MTATVIANHQATKFTPDQRKLVRRAFDEQGFLHVAGAFETQYLQQLHTSFRSRYPENLTKPDERVGMEVGNRRLMIPIRLVGLYHNPALYANPLVMDFVQSVLGTDIVVANLTCVTAFPGAQTQHYHQDHPPLFPEKYSLCGQLPPYAITVAIPLLPLTEKTGTTALVAGSHRDSSENGPKQSPNDYKPYSQLGDFYAMDYRLWHYGTANRGTVPRPIVYILYSRSWFQDSANFAGHPPVNYDTSVKFPRRWAKLFRHVQAQRNYRYE